MKKPIIVMCLLGLFGLVASGAWSAPQAVVEAVQAPAWVERDGRTEAAGVGLSVSGRDRIRTGKDSRIYLKLADGSTVKLAENGELLVESLGRGENRLFTAALDVLKGAFRFTTAKLARPVGRDVKIRVSSVTAGIRGTDIWGRSAPDKDFVCLLEGHITVSHKDGYIRDMVEPLTFYQALRDQPPQDIAKVDIEQVNKWAAETEIAEGVGAARREGKWKLLLAAPETQSEALAIYDKARTAGFAATIRPRSQGDATRYEILLSGFSSELEARGLTGKLKTTLGLEAQPTR